MSSSLAPSADLQYRVFRLVSRADILSLAPALEELAARCGQPGAMHWLAFFVTKSETAGKRVHLLLLSDQPDSEDLDIEKVWAAGFFTEYMVLGKATGIFSTDDTVGYRTIVAPAALRVLAATRMIEELWRTGARAALATVDCGLERKACHLRSGLSGGRWAERERFVNRFFELKPDYEQTLATLGKATRFNLRYYRRRLERSVNLVLEADATQSLTQAELDDLNKRSLNPVDKEEFRLRCWSARELAGSFLMGLRTETGEWLSLVSGWRQGTRTVLYWQLNVRGREKDSIGTVMRSYFLEHEIAHGATSLLVYGGTPHSMRHAFRTDRILDIVLQRQASKLISAVLWTSAVTKKRSAIRPFLAEVLLSHDTVWQSRE